MPIRSCVLYLCLLFLFLWLFSTTLILTLDLWRAQQDWLSGLGCWPYTRGEPLECRRTWECVGIVTQLSSMSVRLQVEWWSRGITIGFIGLRRGLLLWGLLVILELICGEKTRERKEQLKKREGENIARFELRTLHELSPSFCHLSLLKIDTRMPLQDGSYLSVQEAWSLNLLWWVTFYFKKEEEEKHAKKKITPFCTLFTYLLI